MLDESMSAENRKIYIVDRRIIIYICIYRYIKYPLLTTSSTNTNLINNKYVLLAYITGKFALETHGARVPLLSTLRHAMHLYFCGYVHIAQHFVCLYICLIIHSRFAYGRMKLIRVRCDSCPVYFATAKER